MESFHTKDQPAWQQIVDINNDPYGRATVEYAARWASMMEREIAAGKKLEDVAEQLSRDADTEGITGFMYGCAVSMLAHHWIYGEYLRKWHNLKTQIGNEGEQANETGGVLNPALISIK